MLEILLVSAAMALLTVLIHMLGLYALLRIIARSRLRLHNPARTLEQGAAILVVVIGLFVLHGVEIWCYALLYMGLQQLPDLETALYFSASTFTTLGYGDVIIEGPWRLIAAFEGFTGFMMIGWSTAFLVSVIGRMRALEADLLDPREAAERQAREPRR